MTVIVTIDGGLDYCNNQVDKMAATDEEIFTVRIYDRSCESERNWREVAFLQRVKSTIFNH
jgi:hypothetical protein